MIWAHPCESRRVAGSRQSKRARNFCYRAIAPSIALAATLLIVTPAHADVLEDLIERLDRLEEENRQFRQEVEALTAERASERAEVDSVVPPPGDRTSTRFVRINSRMGYELLDPSSNVNRKQRLILEFRRDGTLAPDGVTLHGAVTAVADYQISNRDDKFGYLMRHPTARNQVGDEVSEAAIHSSQLGFTAPLGDWITGHAQILYNPEQSFGSGTNTHLERNQLQMRHAYVLIGNLDRSPVYVSLGKMPVPFGLTDTVNPFTASSVWHAFGALANGAALSYSNDSLSLSLMGVQGGGSSAPRIRRSRGPASRAGSTIWL